MKYRDVIRYYKTPANAAKCIGVTRQAVHNWKIRGRIPRLSQYDIEFYTSGALKRDAQ